MRVTGESEPGATVRNEFAAIIALRPKSYTSARDEPSWRAGFSLFEGANSANFLRRVPRSDGSECERVPRTSRYHHILASSVTTPLSGS
jgi:hypothetical protein